MLSGELVVFLLTLFMAGAEKVKVEPCENTKYDINIVESKCK